MAAACQARARPYGVGIHGIAPGKDVLAVEEKLLKFVPDAFKQHAHHWLILHGRYVCKARKPDCPACLINDLREFRRKMKA